MSKVDQYAFGFSVILMLMTIPTWFDLSGYTHTNYVEYYKYDLSNAIVIATLILYVSFTVKERFLVYFYTYWYMVNVLNIVGVMEFHLDGTLTDFLTGFKLLLDGILWIWYVSASYKFYKGIKSYGIN